MIRARLERGHERRAFDHVERRNPCWIAQAKLQSQRIDHLRRERTAPQDLELGLDATAETATRQAAHQLSDAGDASADVRAAWAGRSREHACLAVEASRREQYDRRGTEDAQDQKTNHRSPLPAQRAHDVGDVDRVGCFGGRIALQSARHRSHRRGLIGICTA